MHLLLTALVSECSVDNIRYNIEFTLANEKITGGNIEITVNKTGGAGVGYSEIFNSSNASSDTAKITWPLTSDDREIIGLKAFHLEIMK